MNTFWKSFPDVERSLTETCELIEQTLHTRNEDIEEAPLFSFFLLNWVMKKNKRNNNY